MFLSRRADDYGSFQTPQLLKTKKKHTKPNNGYSHLHYIPNDTHSLSYSTSKDAIVYKIFLIIGSFLNIRFLDNVQ